VGNCEQSKPSTAQICALEGGLGEVWDIGLCGADTWRFGELMLTLMLFFDTLRI